MLWDSIPTGSFKQLALRVVQLNVSIFITFYSIKQFELTTVAMVNNCATFVILLLGWLILNESTTLFTFTTLSLSFVGTVVLILGGMANSASGAAGSSAFGMILMLSNPVIIATGVIAMR